MGRTRRASAIASSPTAWLLDPRHPWRRTVLYEAHVRGLTIHPSSGAHHAGHYLGVLEKIPYLKDLGVTAVELLPVQAFAPDSCRAPTRIPARGW